MLSGILRFVLILCLALPAAAAADDYARSALQFAEREDWDNARAEARRSGNDALATLIEWQYLLDGESGASFEEYRAFMAEHAAWPEQKKLRLRAEFSIPAGHLSAEEIIAWFAEEKPVSGVGKIALAEALMHTTQGSQDNINALIHEAWRGGDFDSTEEKRLLDTYGSLLSSDDHIARMDRLLWDERIVAAKRMLKLMPGAHEALYKARIALIEDRKIAVLFVAQVAPELRKNPGLTYDRMRYRARRDDNAGVRELLLAAPAHVPYPEKWWKLREQQIRESIDEERYALAAKLLANHGQTEGATLAEALWLQGWLATEFLDKPKEGYRFFSDMYDKVRYPVSKARAAYWAGRAAERSGDKGAAAGWFQTGSTYPNTYYGQLSWFKHHGGKALALRSESHINKDKYREFADSDIGKAITLAVQLDYPKMAGRIINSIAEYSHNEDEARHVTELARSLDQPYLSVRAAKKLFQRNIMLTDAGYPMPATPAADGVERAFTLAITRQESEFDPSARSPSGALGMMQLLPSTAKEMARKNDISFSANRLNESEYNMTLGNLYLARLLHSYDGSYAMTIAAYNAGPGNVRDWVRQFGTPNHDVDNAVNWIEKIPFAETRNYVQRVLENIQVYRVLDAKDHDTPGTIAEDLLR